MANSNDEPRRGPGWAVGAAITGVGLTALGLLNRRRTAGFERAQPAEGQFVTVNDVRLHYFERGSGPAILLIHGNGTSAIDWDASGIVDRLAQTHRVIAIDRPGYGYSERPRTTVWTPAAQAALLAGALRQLGAIHPIVVGHSFGAMVAVALALGRGRDVARLVLLSGYYYPSVRPDAIAAAPSAIPVIGDVLRHTITPLLGAATYKRLGEQLFAPCKLDKAFITANRGLALRPSQIHAEAADGALMVPAATTMRSRYRELGMPVAIGVGAGDRLVDPSGESERLHRSVPGSVFRRIAGAGHMVHYTHGEEVAGLILPAGESAG